MTKLTKKEPTKIKILKAAFSFYKSPCFEQISLNDIAQKVGISKAAIFRHFKNKEALNEAMEDFFFEVTAKYIMEIKDDLSKAVWSKDISLYRIILRNTVKVFFQNPEYLFYMMNLIAISPKGHDKKIFEILNHKLEQRGLSLLILGPALGVNYAKEGFPIFDKKKHTACSYCFVSILFFITVSLSDLFEVKVNTPEELAALTADFLDFGIYREENRISMDEMLKIESKIKIDYSKLPAQNPLFHGLSHIISEYGFPGVTVERLANELGIAKSSLYSYSKSKKELIRDLLKVELFQMVKIIQNNTDKFSKPAEKAYAFLFTITDYFLHRQDVLITYQWIRITGKIFPQNIDPAEFLENGIIYPNNVYETIDTTSVKVSQDSFYSWLGSIASTLVMQKAHHRYSEDDIFELIRICFNYIQQGLTHIE